MAERTYSLSEAAAVLGKHRNTVAGWLEKGCPAVRPPNGSFLGFPAAGALRTAGVG